MKPSRVNFLVLPKGKNLSSSDCDVEAIAMTSQDDNEQLKTLKFYQIYQEWNQ